jgi:hypothetical protein
VDSGVLRHAQATGRYYDKAGSRLDREPTETVAPVWLI